MKYENIGGGGGGGGDAIKFYDVPSYKLIVESRPHSSGVFEY